MSCMALVAKPQDEKWTPSVVFLSMITLEELIHMHGLIDVSTRLGGTWFNLVSVIGKNSTSGCIYG